MYTITEAEEAHSVDVHSRMFKYTLTMGIRVACFIAAFFFLDSWFVWVCLAGATFLPWVAVVIANGAGRDHLRDTPASFVDPPQQAALEARPTDDAGPDGHDGPETMEGEFYTGTDDDAGQDGPEGKRRDEGGTAA
ncbi:DUF3099 domain-containing protein [Zhihengliuella sp.]|uniref:DUF3099 domain-containing protein n=1 Tax=Zhihengliuella sp. TaxID=1954483 RepID=UPI002811FB99|nr:DUF3099 domain-containing protein [Zhihengliuella sp.]